MLGREVRMTCSGSEGVACLDSHEAGTANLHAACKGRP
jgi:hypothetical protein